MVAEPSFVLLLPFSDLLAVDVDDDTEKCERDDRDHHEVPLVPGVDKDRQDEQPVPDHKWLYHTY